MTFRITQPKAHKQINCRCGAVLVANIPFITKHYQGFKSAPCECGSLSSCEVAVTSTVEEHQSWTNALNGESTYAYEDDIVGVWEEPKETTVSEYDLTRVSERFRALEDGRAIKTTHETMSFYPSERFNPEVIAHLASEKCNYYSWSLVPLAPPPRMTRTVTTKLWVYKPGNGNHEICVYRRSESADPFNWETCLGAIEGSEHQEEVEV